MVAPQVRSRLNVFPGYAAGSGLAGGRAWSSLRQDKAGMLGLAIVTGFFLISIAVLFGWLGQVQAIDWVRVNRVPDHVHFVHEAHINRFSGTKQVVDDLSTGPDQIRLVDARKIEPSARVGETIDVAASQVCTICHGNVGAMTTVSQVRPLKMSDCVDCHRDNAAPTDCTTCHY